MTRVAIHGGTIIDGTGAAPVADGAVVFEDGVIASAGRTLDVTADVVIDATGKFVLPGLINMHEHLTYREVVGLPFTVLGDPVRSTYVAVRNARNALSRGWTTLCDMASPYGIGPKIRQYIKAGDLVGPRVLAAAMPISVSGGHATGSGVLVHEADGPLEIRKAARLSLKQKADLIKVMASHDPYCMPGEEASRPEMALDEIEAAYDEARRWGKLTAAHVMGSVAIQNVLDAKVDILHHGTYLTADQAVRMARQGTYFCPTSSAYERQTMNPVFGRGEPWATEHAVLVEPHSQSVEHAVRAGVSIVIGTDSTGSYAEEVELLRKAGMSAMDTLVAATLTGAKALRLDAEIGSIEAGKKADLVILGADPLADPYALEAVDSVILGGAVYRPDQLEVTGADAAAFVDLHRERRNQANNA